MEEGRKVDLTEIEKILPLDPVEQQKALNRCLAELEKELPPILFRNWPKWRDHLPVAPRTVAHADSLNTTGLKEKIMVGRVCGYPRTAFIDWLRERSVTIRCGGGIMNFTEKYNYALRNIQPPGCGNGTQGGHNEPGIMGKIIRTVTECITSFQNGGKTSPFIIINPMTGKEGLTKDGKPSYRSDPCVKELRCAMAEFDNLSRGEQIRSWSAVKLPIVALIDTGGKSIHVWNDVQKLAEVYTAKDWGKYTKNGLYDAALIDMGVDASVAIRPVCRAYQAIIEKKRGNINGYFGYRLRGGIYHER